MPNSQPNKQLTPETKALIETLQERPGLLDKWFAADPRIETLRKIGDTGETIAIPDLLPFVLDAKKELAWEATRAIERLLGEIKPAGYARFDEYIRQGDMDWKFRRSLWRDLSPRDVKRFAMLPEGASAILGVVSCHSSGYVREAAVLELGRIMDGSELPFLLMRANDWVPNIRDRADNLIRSRIKSEYATVFLAWLPLVLRLRFAGRGNHQRLIEAIKGIFEEPNAFHALRAGCDSGDRLLRRFSYEVVFQSHPDEGADLLERAFHDADQRISAIAVRALTQKVANNDNKRLLSTALRSPFSHVRYEALRLQAENDPENAVPELKRALLDRNVAVREEAQFYLNRAGALHLEEFYAAEIATSQGKQLAAAIAGLGETGNKQSIASLGKFVDAKQPQVRAAALRAIAKLDPACDPSIFLTALADDSRSVGREAAAGLLKRVNSIGGETLWDAFLGCRCARAKRGVLFLISRLSRWESYPYLLLALGDPEESVSEAARRHGLRLKQRWNRSFVGPTQAQVLKLREIVMTHDLPISEGEKQFLETELKSKL